MHNDPITRALARAEEVTPAGAPGTAAAEGPVPEATCAGLPLNDYGNGCRLVTYYGVDLLFVPRLGWHRWDGCRWAADEDALEVRKLAQRVPARILEERWHLEGLEELQTALALAEGFEEERRQLLAIKPAARSEVEAARLKELEALREEAARARKARGRLWQEHASHARASGNTPRITNMLREAEPELAVPLPELNRDPLAVNARNGLLRLELAPDEHAAAWGEAGQVARVTLLPHDRGQRVTKMVSAAYVPEAARPRWDRFLRRILPDAEHRRFLQTWFGYCLTGDTSEQKLVFLYGQGRNGKSTMVDVVARIFADYATTLPIETLTGADQRKGSDATPDLVRLPGARLVRASEPEQGQRMKEALIKALTGGEPILVRRMMQEFVEIVPEFKLTLSGNYKPEVRGADDGIWRRIVMVPFEEQIPLEEVNPALMRELLEEAEGILAWLVEGALSWLERGLEVPLSIQAATSDYRRDSDPARLFLETQCQITGDEGHQVNAKFLGEALNAWLVGNGENPWTAKTLTAALRKRAEVVRGPEGERYWHIKSGTNYFRGLRLTDQARERVEVWNAQRHGGPLS
jgi:putative DNA primase/helicase